MIYSLESGPLPDGWTPLEAVAVIKCLDARGETALYAASTDGASPWEALGMLSAYVDTLRQDLADSFAADDD